jgi:glycosyltransferase involved in cell wall biosynthesis
VVVSDGSLDATAAEAAAAGAELLATPTNRGKGAALAAGFAYALRRGARAVATLDGDGQHDPADLPRLLAAATRHPAALVIGQREFDAAVMPRRSLVGNRSSRFWLQLFAPRETLADAQCGYRIYPRWLLERHPPESRRFAVETELLLRAVRAQATVIYVPVRTIYAEGGRSYFRVLPDTLRVFGVAVRSLLWRLPPAPRQ